MAGAWAAFTAIDAKGRIIRTNTINTLCPLHTWSTPGCASFARGLCRVGDLAIAEAAVTLRASTGATYRTPRAGAVAIGAAGVSVVGSIFEALMPLSTRCRLGAQYRHAPGLHDTCR
eukprot:COSAG01_NODE_24554_length_775_cov_0.568047_2_plen_116_part_01